MILSYDANLGRMEFSERTGVLFSCHVTDAGMSTLSIGALMIAVKLESTI
jgi:hypothetical protein